MLYIKTKSFKTHSKITISKACTEQRLAVLNCKLFLHPCLVADSRRKKTSLLFDIGKSVEFEKTRELAFSSLTGTVLTIKQDKKNKEKKSGKGFEVHQIWIS